MASKKGQKDEEKNPPPVEIQKAEEEGPKSEGRDPFHVDILLCLLCEKKLHVPKSLQCLHSFCEPCLTKYVEQIIKQSEGKIEIQCPECKMVVFQTLGKLNAKSYTENLPTGTVCSSMLCEPAISEKVCHFNEGCSRQAVNWCGYCANALCQEHTDLHNQLTTMTIFHPIAELTEAQGLKFPFSKCVHHPKEDMAYFCPRDWSTTCNICGKVQHRTCFFMNRGVLHISEVASEIKASHTTKELEPKLEYLDQESQELSNDRKGHLERLEVQLESGREHIYAYRKIMDEYLDELEQSLKDELNAKYQKVKSDLEQEKKVIDTRVRTVKHYKLMLDAIKTKSTNTQAVTELSKLREQIEYISNDIQQRKRSLKRTNLSVHPINELERILPKMGTVFAKEIQSRQMGTASLRKSKTTLYN